MNGQASFNVIGIDNLKPIEGFQLKDSSYRILCTQKGLAPEMQSMKIVNLTKEGYEISKSLISIPDYGDNYPTAAMLSSDDRLFVGGKSNEGPYPYLSFVFMLNRAADSIKFMQFNSNIKSGIPVVEFNENKEGVFAVYQNRLVFYDKSGNSTRETDSINYRIGLIAPLNDSEFVTTAQKGQLVYVLKLSSTGVVLISDSIPLGDTHLINLPINLVENLIVNSSQDILIGFKRFDSSYMCQNFVRRLNNELKLKWEIPVGFPELSNNKTVITEKEENHFIYIQQSFKKIPIWNALTLLAHFDTTGVVYHSDTLIGKSIGYSFLKSATTTLDNGLLITYACSIPQPIGYEWRYGLLKLDSNCNFSFNTGIKNLGYKSSNIYPNPAKTHLTIETTATLSLIQLHDILGKHIEVSVVQNPVGYEIDFPALTRGVYFLKLQDEAGNLSTQKVMIE